MKALIGFLILSLCVFSATSVLIADDACAAGESVTIFLDIGDQFKSGTTFPIEIDPRQYVLDPDTGDRFVRFSSEQAAAMQRALLSSGYGDEEFFEILLSTKMAEPTGDAPPSTRAEEIEELNPRCGECLNGKVCTIGGQQTCCTGGGKGCMKCKVCP